MASCNDCTMPYLGADDRWRCRISGRLLPYDDAAELLCTEFKWRGLIHTIEQLWCGCDEVEKDA